ncbi:SAM-dependent methyltransferase [Fodinicola feengrottensis]|uniref:SAM-dependent methyltransferase n=1 Tax=Fodinicola feengrottensis TaxID=435914 RepID=A0ABN2J1D1_9ACTN
MTDSDPVIDTSRPSIARVYDYALGGKDNFEVDRQVLTNMLAIDPQMPTLAKEHRVWSRKVVRWLAGEVGIDQFLDCGSGLPTMENTHQSAQLANGDAKVVYVDNDPVVIAHGRALLEDNANTRFVNADLRHPDDLLDSKPVAGFLELDRPIALIQCATIHHIDKLEQQQSIMARYIDRLASGSYVVLTHVHNPGDGGEVSQLAERMEAAYRSTNATTHWRPREEIETLFDGVDLVEPGLVPLHRWWPAGPATKAVRPIFDLVLGGVGRKP